jgi:hypothetical protein
LCCGGGTTVYAGYLFAMTTVEQRARRALALLIER